MSILVITTGGTIGAMPYDDLQRQPIYKTMFADGADIVQEVLERDFASYCPRFVKMEHRDSNFIDEPYRRQLADHVEQAPECATLITHGTDTILITAEYFFHRQQHSPALRDKTIILTGSMVALSCGPESDGSLNLDFSLRQLSQGLESGIYIVLCDHDDVSTQQGWSPRLYPFAPNKYGKTHDTDNMNRDRMFLLPGGPEP